MKLCHKLGLHLICDELYGLSVWETPDNKELVPFKSILSINAGEFMDPKMVHAVWGMSKVSPFGSIPNRVSNLTLDRTSGQQACGSES